MGAFTRARPRAGPTASVRLPLPLAALARRMLDGSIRLSDINRFFNVEPRLAASVPLMAAPAVCGFPSPAEDYVDRPLDFNELLIENLATGPTTRARPRAWRRSTHSTAAMAGHLRLRHLGQGAGLDATTGVHLAALHDGLERAAAGVADGHAARA